MELIECYEKAAQAWCTPLTADKEMDVDLANAFGGILYQCVYQAEQSRRIADARETIATALNTDNGLALGYVSNVAMLLHDRYGITAYDIRNKAATEIVNLVFGSRLVVPDTDRERFEQEAYDDSK